MTGTSAPTPFLLADLLELVSEVGPHPVEVLDADRTFAEIGLDSLGIAEIVVGLEAHGLDLDHIDGASESFPKTPSELYHLFVACRDSG